MDYSFIRENFDINSISKSILSIQISLDGFSFVISTAGSLQSPDYIYIKRPDGNNSESINTALLAFKGFDLKEFYAIRIMVHETFFTLIPETIFDLQDMKAYLNLNHPPRTKSKAISNRISAAGAVCVFSMEQELYEILRDKFPGADFCHTSLPLCSFALNKKTDGCFAQYYEKSIELAVVKDQKLILYNIFEIHSGKDIIYFILNAYKSSDLDPLSHPLYIAGKLAGNSEVVRLAEKYIKNILFYSTETPNIPEKGEFNYPSHYFLNHREILNCEL